MDEIQAFYDEVFPHAEEAVAYIDKFDYAEPLPEDVANLRNLLYSLITVSLAVELWKQPRVKHSANTILTRVELSHGTYLRASRNRRPHAENR